MYLPASCMDCLYSIHQGCVVKADLSLYFSYSAPLNSPLPLIFPSFTSICFLSVASPPVVLGEKLVHCLFWKMFIIVVVPNPLPLAFYVVATAGGSTCLSS